MKHLVVPKVIQWKIVILYHHCLKHPEHTYLEEFIKATMDWKILHSSIREHEKM